MPNFGLSLIADPVMLRPTTDAYLFMAIGYHGQNDKDNACKNYKETLKKNPNNPVAKRNVGSLGC